MVGEVYLATSGYVCAMRWKKGARDASTAVKEGPVRKGAGALGRARSNLQRARERDVRGGVWRGEAEERQVFEKEGGCCHRVRERGGIERRGWHIDG